MIFPVTTAFHLTSGLSGSVAKAGVASTNNVAFDIQKNGSSIGTITFNVTATGSFTFSSTTNFASGDLLQIVAPATRDPTLADVAIGLLGGY